MCVLCCVCSEGGSKSKGASKSKGGSKAGSKADGEDGEGALSGDDQGGEGTYPLPLTLSSPDLLMNFQSSQKQSLRFL